jgi:hypothetical protein
MESRENPPRSGIEHVEYARSELGVQFCRKAPVNLHDSNHGAQNERCDLTRQAFIRANRFQLRSVSLQHQELLPQQIGISSINVRLLPIVLRDGAPH